MGQSPESLVATSEMPPNGVSFGSFLCASGFKEKNGENQINVIPLGDYVRKPFPFFLSKEAQKEPKTPFKRVSRLRARRGLRALDLRRLLKKAGENFL